MTSRMKQRLGLSAALAVTALAVPATASAATTCSFDDATNTVSVAGSGTVSFVAIDRDGTAINVTGETCLDGGTVATVNNTDKIEVTGLVGTEMRMSVDPDNGNLAPGATAEGGTDEIEIEADLTGDIESDLLIHGKSGPDTYRAGMVAGGFGFNMNPSADDGDADVTVKTNGTMRINGSGGGDNLLANGGPGFTGPLTERIYLTGDFGDDTLTGGDGDDVLQDTFGNDTMNGGPGVDELVDSDGNDKLNGGPDTDKVNYIQADKAVAVDLGKVGQQNTGGAGLDTLTGLENAFGSVHNDVLTGTDGANKLEGYQGNDVLMGRGGSDALEGGTGVNTASYARPPAGVNSGVSVAIKGGAQNTQGAGTDTLTGIDNLVGSPFADTFTGDGDANRLEPLGGADSVLAAGGPDTILVRDGVKDSVSCGDGADSVTADVQGLDDLAVNCEAVAFATKPPAAKKPATGGAAADPAPVVSRASISPRKLKATIRRSSRSKARRASLRYTLSEAASVRVAITRKGKKRSSGTLKQKGKAGKNRIRFSAKVGKRRLRPGTYRARIVATDAAGKRSKPVTLTFKVTRR